VEIESYQISKFPTSTAGFLSFISYARDLPFSRVGIRVAGTGQTAEDIRIYLCRFFLVLQHRRFLGAKLVDIALLVHRLSILIDRAALKRNCLMANRTRGTLILMNDSIQ
jgi:hypothetical protein